jgi:hypothetical protein
MPSIAPFPPFLYALALKLATNPLDKRNYSCNNIKE